ncbi:uncharacterized protein SPPG_01617 [Spizellomyces punctatus DAOM BR117]|uniref:Uncharacterized protein n=1 Tax=Spizellomyces punctatus (strain DAOM BR117) TaxID=645134 RepID=A0A0L0HSV2_SPIPD|nr:uncharacterized protein SPPG_01617 [Spizellomyces punctatus DAOM BR117]KND04183.1 hypothetical protein SPPG_01617 [Spizellomyces punctatus DAOM BR117]|eukprot:XP_016612222.1 hypothetical protein SPPG_01617 [Spizellomyces punctatus DAOM BR117]
MYTNGQVYPPPQQQQANTYPQQRPIQRNVRPIPQHMQALTQEQLKGIIASAQALKEKGSTEANDPEFAQKIAILRQYSSLGKNLAQQQQQQQQQQQVQQVQQHGVVGQQQQQRGPGAQWGHGQIVGSGLPGGQVSAGQGPVGQGAVGQVPVGHLPAGQLTSGQVPVGQVQAVHPQQHSQPKDGIPPPPPTSQPSGTAAGVGPFTPEQLTALRCQIYVFKLISGNKPVPEHLRQRVFDADQLRQSQTPNESETHPIPQKIVESVFQHPTPPKPNQDPSPVLKATTARFDMGPLSNPYSLLPKKISVADLQQRVVIPSGTPSGIDAYALMQEREKQIQARIQYRISELENLPSNLSNDTGAKLKALIELKSLKLLDKQKRLRSDIVQCLSKATTLATAPDRGSFRRMKKQSLREAKQTEKLEKNQRLEREKRERQKHVDYLLSILHHGREMLGFHKQQQNKATRLGQAVARFHVAAQKEEEKRQQRISQERLNALKANDEAAYLKLVDKAKDNRIMHLLNQTESYLNSLTKAMQDQKASVVEYEVPEHEPRDGNVDDDGADYYATAHKITEHVTEQPSILVGGRLKEYQIKGLQWMVSLYNNRLNGILADEMGLGKTIQTISLITYLMEKKKQNGPFLVIVPLSTITNWDLEFERWAPTVNRIVFKGTAPERARLRNEIKAGYYNVLITTYEYIIREKSLLAKTKWVYMIIDEGHRMKNTQSKLSITLMQYYSTRYRLILTGTPLQNNLPELWALLNFILPKIFNSVETFDDWFNHPFSKEGGKETDMKLNEEESLLIIRGLHKVLRPFLLRRLKKDVESELPDKVETVVKCPMSALQLRLYEQIRSKKSSFGVDGATRRKALNNLVMQFRKVCNHPYVFEEVEHVMNPTRMTDDNLWRVAGKFELLDRILPKFKTSGHRVLMFFQMTQVMDIMEDYLRLKAHTYLRLDGHTKAEDRTTMLKVFNNPVNPPFIFLLSTRAGGLGLNLQTADTVVIFDSDWNPHQDLQAQDRAHRIGQTKEVRILRLITARSVEETILARAQYKLDIDGKVIQAGKFDNKTTDRERDELLRSLFGSEEDEDDKGDNEGQLDDNDLNEIIARNEEELELFNKMDAERNARELSLWRAAGNRGDPPPRLMQDSELPSVYVQEEELPTEQEIELGRGARARKEVRYDDGLNEDQFLAGLDSGDLDGYIEKRWQQRAKREERKKNRHAGDDDDDQDDEDGQEEIEQVVYKPPVVETPKVPGRKRGRPPKKRPPVVEEVEDTTGGGTTTTGEPSQDMTTPQLPKKRGRKPKPKEEHEEALLAKRRRKKFAGVDADEVDPLPPAKRRALRRVFEACYKAVDASEVVYENGARRLRSGLFQSIPPRAQYPDYYKLIRSPIALDMIWHRLIHVYYKSLQQFIDDFHLMFANAMQYNVDGSEVYDDAVQMKHVFDSKIAELAPGGDVPILPIDEAEPVVESLKRKRSEASSHFSDDEKRKRWSDDDDSVDNFKPKKRKRESGVPGIPSKYGQLPKIKMKLPPRVLDEGAPAGENLEDGEIME